MYLGPKSPPPISGAERASGSRQLPRDGRGGEADADGRPLDLSTGRRIPDDHLTQSLHSPIPFPRPAPSSLSPTFHNPRIPSLPTKFPGVKVDTKGSAADTDGVSECSARERAKSKQIERRKAAKSVRAEEEERRRGEEGSIQIRPTSS